MSGLSPANAALINADADLIAAAKAHGFTSPVAYTTSDLSQTAFNRLLDAARAAGPVSEPTGPIVHIDQIGGNCPVQAEGTINGVPFYFRARGTRWSIGIGGDPVAAPAWSHLETYGSERFSAGWMTVDEALTVIASAAAKYHAERSAS